jgi:succinate dehydrogenase (ubiquinone) iron-sulfur subunit
MNVDGTNTVAFLKPVDAATGEVIRDLVVDLTIFYLQYK